MRNDVGNRITGNNCAHQRDKREILRFGERKRVGPLKLNPDRPVVATLVPSPRRNPGMPRTPLARDKLRKTTVTAHQEVRRHLQAAERVKEGVRVTVKSIHEKPLYRVAVELPRGQADAMDNKRVHFNATSGVLVRGRHLIDIGKNPR